MRRLGARGRDEGQGVVDQRLGLPRGERRRDVLHDFLDELREQLPERLATRQGELGALVQDPAELGREPRIGRVLAHQVTQACAVTSTVKVVETVVEFPARSVAVAVKVCDPSPKPLAGPFTSAQVFEASPESASVAVQVIATVSPTP